jgi:hypothetical protein
MRLKRICPALGITPAADQAESRAMFIHQPSHLVLAKIHRTLHGKGMFAPMVRTVRLHLAITVVHPGLKVMPFTLTDWPAFRAVQYPVRSLEVVSFKRPRPLSASLKLGKSLFPTLTCTLLLSLIQHPLCKLSVTDTVIDNNRLRGHPARRHGGTRRKHGCRRQMSRKSRKRRWGKRPLCAIKGHFQRLKSPRPFDAG